MSGLGGRYFIARFFKNGRLQKCIEFSEFRHIVILCNNFEDWRNTKEHRIGRVELVAVQAQQEILVNEFKTDIVDEVEQSLVRLKNQFCKTIPRLG